jgi:CMP-N-acetylneuraminic acid synthetase
MGQREGHEKMRVLAVIPARGGSKRVPGKNLREVGGISLVGRSIISAMKSELVTDIAVSTDSEDIKAEALHWLSQYRHLRKHYAIIQRDPRMATDSAPLDAVIVDGLRKMNSIIEPTKIDKVVTLQPTSPLRPPGLIDQCIKAQVSPINSVLTVHDAGHFFWGQDTSHPTVKDRYMQMNARGRPNSQDLGKDRLWAENGCVYVTDAYSLLASGTRTIFHSMVIPISVPHAVDIDTEEDFQLAEALAEAI